MSNVLISVVSEFDKKGFTQADKGLSALTKSTAKFIGGLALAHKAQKAMLSYMADEKATKILAQNLKNLGFAYGSAGAEEFVASLQQQTGILDDELRPAYAQLARVTGSSMETQKLMALAFDVSSGTGQDYASVINALSRAYVGNTKGLKSLNIGLTDAELKTKSFSEITELLNQQFKGAGGAALDSYAGKMAILQVTTANAAETIGKSLLDAISTASGEGGFDAFIKDIDNAAASLSRLITIAGRGVAAIKIFGNPTKTMQEKLKEFKQLQTQVWAEDLSAAQRKAGMKVWYPEQKAAATALAKLEKDRLALLKKQTAEKKAQAAIDKANALIAKANEKFDIEGIQIAAALKNQTLNEEERKRLELKQAIWNLEQAIAQNDSARIASATALLEKLLGQYNILEKIKTLALELGGNIELIDLTNLAEALSILMAIKNVMTSGEGAAGLAAATTPEAIAWQAHEEAITANRRSFLSSGALSTGTTPPVVNVTVSGDVKDIIDVVVDGLQNKSASGVDTRILRNTGGFNW